MDSCSVPNWTAEDVGRWLTSIQLKDHAAMFVSRNVTGLQLLQLDSAQMKVHCIDVCRCHLILSHIPDGIEA